MKRLKLILGAYTTKPVGFTHGQFEHLYQLIYKPFLTLLYAYPKISMPLHFSGILLEWFEEKHPEIIMLINEMVKRKQVEMIGGGYYSPVFSIIPNKDRIGQIELLTTALRKKFGKRPRGCWLPELVWEPALVSMLNSSGMGYTFLEDNQFITAGLCGNDFFRPCITEDQGKTVMVLPISSEFSSAIPRKEEPAGMMERIVTLQESGDKDVLTIQLSCDDMGLSPGTKGAVEREGWFETFFNLLLKNGDRVKLVLPGQYLRNKSNIKKAYFPCSAFSEISTWSMTAAQQDMMERFLKDPGSDQKYPFYTGGYFRQFLSKYSESAHLYAKMMYVNLLINVVRRDRSRKKSAREESWKGQCGSAYWHGRYTGIYDNRLRKKAYFHFIEAEKLTREKGIFSTSIQSVDIDFDGSEEVIYQGQNINAYVHRKGGTLFELDYLVTSWNYLDTMGRYKEPYHDDEDSENGFDSFARKSFADHFISSETSLEDFRKNKYRESGSFLQKQYKIKDLDKEHKNVIFQCDGTIRKGKKQQEISISKKFDFSKNTVDVHYLLENTSSLPIEINFAVEINLSFIEGTNDYIKIESLEKGHTRILDDDKKVLDHVKELAITDIKQKTLISLSSSRRYKLWSFPVYTIVNKNSEKQKLYQGNCFLMQWELEIPAGNTWDVLTGIKLEKR